jgi:hypothetical protein
MILASWFMERLMLEASRCKIQFPIQIRFDFKSTNNRSALSSLNYSESSSVAYFPRLISFPEAFYMIIGTSLPSIYQFLITFQRLRWRQLSWRQVECQISDWRCLQASYGTSISEHMLIAFDQLFWFANCVRGWQIVFFPRMNWVKERCDRC